MRTFARLFPLCLLLAACEPNPNTHHAPPETIPVWSVAGVWDWVIGSNADPFAMDLEAIVVEQDGLVFTGRYENAAGETIEVEGRMNGVSMYGTIRVLNGAGEEVRAREMLAERDLDLPEFEGYMRDNAGETARFRVLIDPPEIE